MFLQYLLLILGLASLACALLLLYMPRRVAAAVPAYAGMLMLHMSYFIEANTGWLLFKCIPLGSGEPLRPNECSCRFFTNTVTASFRYGLMLSTS